GVGGRVDDDVGFRRVERAVRLIGERGVAVGQPGLQHDIAGLEDLVIGHIRRPLDSPPPGDCFVAAIPTRFSLRLPMPDHPNALHEIPITGESIAPGEAYLAETPVLRTHAGTQPDLFLRWNAVPKAAAAVDVVVHLHGFSQQRGDMALAEKVPRSGLDLSRRARPTLALLPRGNWLGRTYYDFPALLDGGLDRLVDYAIEQFARAAGLSKLGLGRFILTAH